MLSGLFSGGLGAVLVAAIFGIAGLCTCDPKVSLEFFSEARFFYRMAVILMLAAIGLKVIC